MAVDQVPGPLTYWVKFVMTKRRFKISSTVACLAQRCSSTRRSTGQDFFEQGFSIPTGDLFRELLNYYKIELVHLN